MPALFSNTSMRPKRSATSLAHCNVDSSDDTSARKYTTSPWACNSATADAPRSSSMSTTATLAPSSRNRWAYVFPMPWPAPVTIATLFSRRIAPLLDSFDALRFHGAQGRGLGPVRDGLRLGVLVQSLSAVLAADAGPLVAAEGSLDRRTAVDFYGARADLQCHLEGASGVGGPDGPGQAVPRIVGDADRVIVGVVADDHSDRAEDLLLGDGVAVVDIGQQRWFVEEARREVLGDPTTRSEDRAVTHRGVDHARDPLPLHLTDQWAHLGRRIRGIADLDRPQYRRRLIDKRGKDGVVHQEPRAKSATLSRLIGQTHRSLLGDHLNVDVLARDQR